MDRKIGQMWVDGFSNEVMIQTQDGPVAARSVVIDRTEDTDGSVRDAMPHVHRDSNGLLHRCYHKCRSIFTWQFFAGLTLSFPIEHALWTKVTPFVQIAEFLGLGLGHH